MTSKAIQDYIAIGQGGFGVGGAVNIIMEWYLWSKWWLLIAHIHKQWL